MVRHGPNGHPVPAARFLSQQLTLEQHFCQAQAIIPGSMPPSNVVLSCNEHGMPVLGAADVHVLGNTHEDTTEQVCMVICIRIQLSRCVW